MAQLFFKYGTMNSGKSIEILKVAHNYEEQGKHTVLLTSAIDDRYGVGAVTSRIGISRDAIPLKEDTDVYSLIYKISKEKAISCVLIDEAQFLTREQVRQLAYVVDDLDIPVMAFGLKNDFRNELFPGSHELLLQSDKLEEIKTICHYCNKKATMVLRIVDGKPVSDGDQVQIGGNESYISTCRKHWHRQIKKSKENT